MRTVNFGALFLFGISLAALPAAAMSIPKNSGYELPYTIQAANKNSKKPKRNHNYSSGKGFIPGYVQLLMGVAIVLAGGNRLAMACSVAEASSSRTATRVSISGCALSRCMQTLPRFYFNPVQLT